MPEEVPSPQPSERPQQGPNFHIDPEEAWGLGLTVSESMLYGRTGVLPDRVEWLNATTLRDQTLTSRGPLRLSPEERAALAAYWDKQAGRTPQEVEAPVPEVADALEPAPRMPDYAAFKPWALTELQTIRGEVNQILADDPTPVSSRRVLARVMRWDTARYNTWAQSRPDTDIPDAISAIWPLVDDILGRPDLPLDTRADLVDAMTHLHVAWDRPKVIPKLVKDMEINGPALTIRLFERQNGIDEYGLMAIRQALQSIRDPEARREIAIQALMPLARKVKHARNFYDYHFRTIHTVVECVDESDKSTQEAAECGVHLNDAADTIIEAFNTQFKAGMPVPRHHELLTALPTLERLYFPQHAEPRTLPPSVKAFVEKVYQERVPGEESHSLMKQLAGPFNHLASACGSDLRIRG